MPTRPMRANIEKIGEYDVIQQLGTGAVGAVFEARHQSTGDIVAIKLMHERLANEPDVQNRFVREVSVLQKLDHPNIVSQIDCGLDDGQIYLVMERVDCGALEEVMSRRGKLSWREAVEVAMQICDGLAHAHERGVIHRDLKPANLFLSATGHVKVGDFGLAQDASMPSLTSKGNTVGSCRYMAPEQVRGEKNLTGSVDLYALGCLLFRMLSGKVPFDGATIMEIFEHHLFTDVPNMRAGGGDWPEALDELVNRLLAKDVAQRPSDAAEVKQALQQILAGNDAELTLTTGKPHANAQTTIAPANPNLTERLVGQEPQEDLEVSSIWTWLMLSGGVVAILAVIAFIAMSK